MPNHTFEKIPLRKLLLDGSNPRHEAIDTEPAIIARLYTKEKVLPLAKDIAQYGLDPTARMAVVPHPNAHGHYFPAEGNRRLCALKLLLDPAKAPSPAARRAIEQLRGEMLPLPQRIDVAVFPSRVDARHWLLVRHLGEMGGIGTRTWKSGAKTRFDAQGTTPSTPNAQALAMLDYAQETHLLTEDQRSKVPLSTITRYLTNPVLRDALGLVNHEDLLIAVDVAEFNRGIGRFLLDSIPPARGTHARVKSRSDSNDRKAYAAALRSEGIAPTTRLQQPVLATPTLALTGARASRSRRQQRSPDDRLHVVPADYKPTLHDPVLKRVFDELRTIDPDEFSFSAAYLLRAFVEQVAVQYAQKFNLGHNGDLHNVIARCAAHLSQQGASDKATKVLNVMGSEKHAKVSPHTLGAAVHCSLIPKAIELKRQWENIEPGYTLMIQALN